LANLMRLSLLKAAHAVVSRAAWQEIRVRSGPAARRGRRDDKFVVTRRFVISSSRLACGKLREA
jgi:hypothetical protein